MPNPTYTPSRPVQPSGKGPGWYLLLPLGGQERIVIVQKLKRRADAPKGHSVIGPYKTRKQALTAAAKRQSQVVDTYVATLAGALRSITAMCNRWWIVRIFHGKTFRHILDHAHNVLDRYDRA